MTSVGRGFKAINFHLQAGRSQLLSVLEEDGTVSRNRNRIAQRAKEFYEKLFSSNQSMSSTSETTDEFPHVTSWEVEKVVRDSKSGKSRGPDGLSIDLLKA